MFNSVDDIPADLRWLAESEHEWKPGPGRGGNIALIYKDTDQGMPIAQYCHPNSAVADQLGVRAYSREQHQSARDLISGKPGWDEAPEWARWLAQDESGEWWWFEYKPSTAFEFKSWTYADPESEFGPADSMGTVLGDWRDTLEHKPADEPTPEEDDHFAGPTAPEDIGNALLDGDAPHTKVDPCASPVTFADLDQPLVSTVARELRVTHFDGHIDVEYLFEGGVMLTDDQGCETQIPDEETLTAVYHAALRVLRGES